MNREIKFRAWNGEEMSRTFDFGDLSYEGFPDICLDDTEEEIMPNVIFMQFSGIKDKNGKEIYIGDIVKCYDGDFAEIIESQCIILGKTKSHDYMLCNMKGEDLEVKGNIYENPELIT